MNWRLFDLNLLVVFDAVARVGSIARAAANLNMSPSAVSHAITRLRRALDDDLFERGSDGIVPTPRALELAGLIRGALDSLQSALAPSFDPATSRRGFTIAFDNRSTLVLAPPLTRHISVRAPGVSLDIVPSGTLDLIDQIDRGLLDLAVTVVRVAHRLSATTLFEDGFAVLSRPEHPAAVASTVSVEDLARYGHICISSTGDDHGFVDSELAKAGLTRQIVCRTPLLSADSILLESDLLAVVGERTARSFARMAGLNVMSLPFQTPSVVTSMLWHPRCDTSPAHQWLRDTIREVAPRALA